MEVLSVRTDHGATEQEIGAVGAALRESGLEIGVGSQISPRGASGPDGWVVYLLVSGFFTAAGAAGYAKLSALVRRIASSRQSNRVDFGSLIIRDERGGDLAIAITEKTLPPEAWDQLDQIVTSGIVLRDRRYYWHPIAREWRSHALDGPYPYDVPLPEQMPPRHFPE